MSSFIDPLVLYQLLLLLFSNQLQDQLLLIDFFDILILVEIHCVVISIFQKLILYILIHHVESVFRVVLRSTWHLFYYFCPFIADFYFLLEDENVFLDGEWLLFDLRIQKVDPAFSALLSISIIPFELQLFILQVFIVLFHQVLIENERYLIPMLGTIFLHNLDELVIFFFAPNTFLDAVTSLLVIPVEALGVIATRDESRDLNPIILLQVLRLDALAFAESVDGPDQESVLILGPSVLGLVISFLLKNCQLIKYLRCLIVCEVLAPLSSPRAADLLSLFH